MYAPHYMVELVQELDKVRNGLPADVKISETQRFQRVVELLRTVFPGEWDYEGDLGGVAITDLHIVDKPEGTQQGDEYADQREGYTEDEGEYFYGDYYYYIPDSNSKWLKVTYFIW